MFQTTEGDVLVTLHKRQEKLKIDQVILGSAKTKTHMKKLPAQSSKPVQDKENIAPWSGKDPWGGYNKFPEAEEGDQRMTSATKWERLHGEVQEVVATSLRDATEQRFLKLETGMNELKEQNTKFEQWFQDAGNSTASLRQEVGAIATQVKEHHNTIQTMGTEIKSGFASLEALLSKKHRTE